MKTYKQFIAEVQYAGISAKEKNWAQGAELLGRTRKAIDNDAEEKPHASGKIVGQGEWVLYGDHSSTYADFTLIAYDSKQKAVVVATLNASGSAYKVYHLVSKTGSTIKAADLYASFVRSGRMLQSDSQSEGGRKVWAALSKKAGITVYGWDNKKRQPVNLGNKLDVEISDIHHQPEFDDEVENLSYSWDASRKEKSLASAQMQHYDNVDIVAAPSDKKVKIIKPKK